MALNSTNTTHFNKVAVKNSLGNYMNVGTEIEAVKATTANLTNSSTDWINILEYIDLVPGEVTGVSAENSTKMQGLINQIEAKIDSGVSKGVTLYCPNGLFQFSASPVKIKKSGIKFKGAGKGNTIFRRSDNTNFLIFLGVSVNTGSDEHIYGNGIEDIQIQSYNKYTTTQKPLVVLECVSSFNMDRCYFEGSGTHIEFVEAFDSTINATDFQNSGRRTRLTGLPLDTITYDATTTSDDYTPTLKMSSNVKSYNQPGYETTGFTIEKTNQIKVSQCRFEGFTGGVLGLNGEGTNTLRFSNNKYEGRGECQVPIFVFKYSLGGSTFEGEYFYRQTGTASFGDTSAVPYIFISGQYINNIITGSISGDTYNSVPFNTDLIRIITPYTYNFAGNKFELGFKSIDLSSIQKVTNGKYVINHSVSPHNLYCNGNQVNIRVINEAGTTTRNNYQALPTLNTLPGAGIWCTAGEKLNYTIPDADGYTGAICTVGGAGGTWKRFGKIEV